MSRDKEDREITYRVSKMIIEYRREKLIEASKDYEESVEKLFDFANEIQNDDPELYHEIVEVYLQQLGEKDLQEGLAYL